MSALATPAKVDEQRWLIVCKRERCGDASFVYAVQSTGVFCRPGCASRLPRRENVLFFDGASQARAAGFRACKRCKPDEEQLSVKHRRAIQRACQAIDDSEQLPDLTSLARIAGLSPTYFHRLFKRELGVTPKGYAAARRVERVRRKLREEAGVSQAAFASGYGASSRFYAEAAAVLGMKPSQYRNKGQGVAIRAAIAATSLGPLLIAATDKGVCAIEFGDDEQQLRARLSTDFSEATLEPSDDFCRWIEAVIACVDQPRLRMAALPLDMQGTAFQRQVWELLRKIPLGSRATYSEIARRLGKPAAARAVAGACAANRLAVVVPCHRVLRTDGGMGGYRWGIGRKKKLLAKESAAASRTSKS